MLSPFVNGSGVVLAMMWSYSLVVVADALELALQLVDVVRLSHTALREEIVENVNSDVVVTILKHYYAIIN